jgi:hypothetical protein
VHALRRDTARDEIFTNGLARRASWELTALAERWAGPAAFLFDLIGAAALAAMV